MQLKTPFINAIPHLEMLRNRILLFFCLIWFSGSFSQEAEDDWHLRKKEQGISVYSRKTAKSNFKELKSVVYLKTSLSSAVALINDWESYPQWVYKCGKSTTLKVLEETKVIHYQTVIVPWPAEDRDFIVNIELSQNEKTKIVTIKSTCNSDYIPPVENHVRITEMDACWTLVPFKDGTIQITYQLLVNPGGFVPAWLVNMAAVDGPFESMANFKIWVQKKKYQEASLPFIKELD
jgi:hypothetical protein